MQVIENIILAIAIRILKRGYGADCLVKDTVEMPELALHPSERCASCLASECIDFLQETIDHRCL